MAGQEKWYFPREQLQNSPSRKCGLDADKELAYRQQAANLIQDMGQRLQVSQLCINTAIVYMHRFYAFHSFTQFHRNAIAAAALFLAAKVEEQPRKLEYVIKVAHVCLHRGEGTNGLTSEQYQEQAQDLVFNENVLLQTLGFDVAIDHPHTHVVRTCHLVKAPKDLAQTSYFMASNSLHLTTMCLQYRPTVVACFCIHLASKWSNWAIPQSNEGRHWFSYVDRSVTSELLERLTSEFLHIFDKCPSRLKRKMMTMSNNSGSSPHSSAASGGVVSSPFHKSKPQPAPAPACDDFDKAFDREYEREKRRPQAPGGYVPAATSAATSTAAPTAALVPTPAPTPSPAAAPAPTTQKIDYNVYREKKEREERERRQQQQARPPVAPPPRAPPRPAQPHHKPHAWPHHKPPHHKPPHEHRRPPEPQRTRPPSLFSPENATTPTAAAASAPRRPQPPPPRRPEPQPPVLPPSPHKKRPTTEATSAVREMQPPAILSPFSSPPLKETIKPRQRVQSNSEPELVPVVKKLDETPGYENVIRDSQRGTIRTKGQEQRAMVAPTRPLNGIETDPTLVSNLLKESLAKPAPITVQTEKKSPLIEEVKREPPPEPPRPAPTPAPTPAPPPVAAPTPLPPVQSVAEEVEPRHKKEKKKKEKHKHKDRDKSKEERKKHKKDRDKEKKKESSPQPPPQDLKITIPRDIISQSPGLKIKIPKERLVAPPPPPHGSGIKIKISKDLLDTSRKRNAPHELPPGPPHKLARQNGAPHPHKVENAENGLSK